ncbi:MAG: carbon-nitrogen hydrolase [Desulfobacteraceae bacterium 4484_190.1]|nr:MAG: carbon-nitrogen hydrolase [Desulfobacteraceae bacterium 4484_190.1]
MLLASIQMAVVEDDKAATIEKAVGWIREAKDADLIILPELWNIGFMSFERYVSEAEDKDGPTLSTFRTLARELKVYLHTGSFVEEDGGKYYNSSYLLSPRGEILVNYRKVHLFGFNSRETQILTHGNRMVVAETEVGTFGLATCYDLRFPELFRRMVEKGAEVFLVCSAWPYPRLEHWILLNRVRALENQCFLVSSNSVGLNRGSQFVGHSMMVDPWGIILASGGDDEAIVRSEIDLDGVRSARERFPALADRQEWLSRKE